MVRASASGAVDLGLIPSRVSFAASRLAYKRPCGEQAGKFTCRAVWKDP